MRPLSSRSYPGGSDTVSYGYDAAGNLLVKDDYAQSYTYNSNRPNAVAAITKVASLGGATVTFGYDANGNLTQGDGKSLSYTAFNKPATITAGGITATFDYGADLSRYKQEKSSGETILYIDKLMEIVTVGGTSDYRHYLGAEAILTKVGDINDPYPVVNFTLRDRLGSVVTITDAQGTVTETRGYDPFGKPRDGDWAEKVPPTLNGVATERGFTDHEHLDESKLIHMNGRAYDYQLGRFLSVDPIIQAPGNSQSLNPYSYIMNNPLAGTDPSGYASTTETKLIKEQLPGSRIKQVVGANVVVTTTDDDTGDVTNVTAINTYKGQTSGVSTDMSNGKATKVTSFTANAKSGDASMNVVDINSLPQRDASPVSEGSELRNDMPSPRSVSRASVDGQIHSWTVDHLFVNSPESSMGAALGVHNRGEGYQSWVQAGGDRSLSEYPLVQAAMLMSGLSSLRAAYSLRTAAAARAASAVAAGETLTLRAAVSWQLAVKRYSPRIGRNIDDFFYYAAEGYSTGKRPTAPGFPAGDTVGAYAGYWLGYAVGLYEGAHLSKIKHAL